MSYVIAAPEMMAATATDLATIGSDLSAAHMAAATPTVALVPAAADEVSAGIAHLFSRYAQDFHRLAGKAAAFNDQFVQHLHASARSYAATETANATLLQPLKAVAGTSTSNVLSALLAELTAQLKNAPLELQTFLNSLATATPQQLLKDALLILFSPIWVPLAVVLDVALILLVNSTIGQIPPGTLF
jgi:hypothetical protein